jgi:hypothetical protein
MSGRHDKIKLPFDMLRASGLLNDLLLDCLTVVIRQCYTSLICEAYWHSVSPST